MQKFENCSAYVMASEAEWQTRLSHLMRQVGFAECFRMNAVRSLAQRHPGHLPFLLIHSEVDKEQIIRIVREVRSAPDDNIRFMPIIVLSADRSEGTIRRFIALGCDDIVLYPCTAGPLGRRLRLQIDQHQDYYQTSSYFGPDRRRGEEDGEHHPGRKQGRDSFYRHIAIKRDPRGGVKVLSSQSFEPQQGGGTAAAAAGA